jgi:hypothetical protein
MGAGASFDCAGMGDSCVTDVEYRPPLTKDLFQGKSSFNRILQKYPGAVSLSDDIRARLRPGNVNLEDILQRVTSTTDLRLRRLAWQVPLYFQELMGTVSDKYITFGASKFDTLLHYAQRSPFEKVLFLSLNYDFLLEKAFQQGLQRPLNQLDLFCPEREKQWLVKLHGSVLWGRRMQNNVRHNRSAVELLESINGDLELSDEIETLTSYIPSNNVSPGKFLYPCITPPIAGDKEFSCPPAHIEKAKAFLTLCRRFLVIGFSGLDAHVLELLRENQQQMATLMIVSGNRNDGLEVFNRLLKANIKIPSQSYQDPSTCIFDGGFVQFMESDTCRSFFSSD